MMKNQLIGYTTIGTNDLDRAKEFYNNLFSEIGAVGFAANDRVFLWRVDGGSSMFAVTKPYDEKEATVGNGNMIALPMDSRDQVDSMYAKAMALGATDEGEPGERTNTFYGAYVRDLDGNKLVFYILSI